MSIRIDQMPRIVKKQTQRIRSMSEFAYAKLEAKSTENKATTSTLLNKLKNILENINYKQLTKRLNKEFSKSFIAEEEKLNKKTNPINEKNIDRTKKAIERFINSLGSNIPVKKSLKEKIINCNNPQELYKLLKDGLASEIMPKHNFVYNIFRGKTQDYRKEMTIKYIKMLTPRTTDPAVLKLEQELKTMGISEVNFSNDYDYAQIAKATIEKIRKMPNVTLPNSITVTPALPNTHKGKNIRGLDTDDSSHIFLSPFSNFMRMRNSQIQMKLLVQQSPTFKNASPTLQRRLIETLKRPTASTNSDGHILAHEIGHNFGSLNLMNKSEIETAKQISKTSTQKTFKLNLGCEVGPELFAKIVAGEKLTEQETALFIKHCKIDLPINH